MRLEKFIINPFKQVAQISLCHNSSLDFCFRGQYFSNILASDLIKDVRISTIHEKETDLNSNILRNYIVNRIQQFNRTPHLTNIKNFSRAHFLIYISMTFNEILFYLSNILDAFAFCTQGLLWHAMINIGRAQIFIENAKNGSSILMTVYSNFDRRKKRTRLYIFPYRRFIIRPLYCRHSSDIHHHRLYPIFLRRITEHISARVHSKLLCKILTYFSRNGYGFELVFRQLRNICTHNENESYFIDSSTSFWTLMSNMIRRYCKDM